MKKLYFLLLLFTGIVNAQIVNIPDANFKAILLALGHDVNSNGEIDLWEAQGSTAVVVANANISDMTGIEAFTNIDYLDCKNNNISSLDVSALTLLNFIDVRNNQLTSLNIDGLTALSQIDCSNNQLTSLSLSNLTGLALECGFNQLTSLSLTNVSGASVYARSNQLTSLTLSNVNIGVVDVGDNLLTSLDLSGLSFSWGFVCNDNLLTSLIPPDSVSGLRCENNQLTTLDFSNTLNLVSLVCANNPLTYLNVKNGYDGETLYSNDHAFYICADESEIAELEESAFAGTVISSYCSFTPGGNYNTISGNLHYDADGNGCTSTDIVPTNMRMNITDDTNSGATFLDADGNYKFYVGIGNHTITPSQEVPEYFNITPASSVLNFPLLNGSTQIQDFCITANGIHPDAEIILVPINGARPGFDANYQLVYKNKGNQSLSGTINLAFDDDHTDFVLATPAPNNVAPNTLLWNYVNLQPFETRVINITLNLNSPQEIPALNAGDNLIFTANINFVDGDVTPGDNLFELLQPVVNSYDPNDKTCLEGTNVIPEHIGKYLHYNINFENTGTESAINIVVRDVIDTTKFDINSLQLLYASHVVYPKITGNVVEFIFENIMLPIGGHGNVLFKIKTLPTLNENDHVSNTANIYFDYNFPIVTNEARTIFNNLAKTDFVKDNSVTVYPNPTKNVISIKAKSNVKSIQLYDIQGRILQTTIDDKKETTLDISGKQNGVYFLKIFTETGSTTEKIIKE